MIKIEDYFCDKSLNEIILSENIDNSKTCGVDKISSKKLLENKDKIIKGIIGNVLTGNYKFTPYKINLILKAPDVSPRTTCIPTIKDKIVIATIKKYLYDCYPDITLNISANTIARETIKIKEKSTFDFFIKIDITDFFGSIDQELLIEILKKKIHDKIVIKLIKEMISNPRKYTDFDKKVKVYKGIPQGLSISVLLANIYLHELDKKYKKNKKINYFRYVDDILIFCNEKDAVEIKNRLINELKLKYSLQVNLKKFASGMLTEEFEFLGYRFLNDKISVRLSSKRKFEKSLEEVFKRFSRIKDKNSREIERFIWILNYKICGIVCDGKRYGWLYYFSCITDISILKQLDNLIEKFIKRFGLDEMLDKSRIKTFTRSYYEIRYQFHDSTYLLKYNNIGLDEMCDFLEIFTGMSMDRSSINGIELERKFRYCFFNQVVKHLEKDLDDISR